jgi:uncharacterized protein (TIGR02118 family)
VIKFLIAFARAPGLSREASHAHYRVNHGPLVKSVPTFWNHVNGYVQNFVLEHAETRSAQIDGLSELWFDDWNSFAEAFADARYQEVIRPDEARFADFNHLLIVFANEVALFGGGGTPPIKLLRFIKRDDDIPPELFGETWRGRYAAAIASDHIIRKHASAYIQNRPKDSGENPFPLSEVFDGVDEYWFASMADIEPAMAAERRIADLTGMSSARREVDCVEFVASTLTVKAPERSAEPLPVAGLS